MKININKDIAIISIAGFSIFENILLYKTFEKINMGYPYIFAICCILILVFALYALEIYNYIKKKKDEKNKKQ